jgi:predicted metalloprotease with PDZ domain
VWSIATDGGRNVIIRYRIALDPQAASGHAAWYSILKPTGASVNSTDTFLYPLDYPDEPARVRLAIPASWRVATELADSGNSRELFARNSYDLVDTPIMMGDLRHWSFNVRGIPHRVAYWPLPNAATFDTTEFVGSIERFANATFDLFGSAPYSSYTFLFQDGTWGGLEHTNSAQLGVQSTDLASNPRHYMGEIAHEFFHTWNLMALDPLGPNKVTADPPTPTKELWFTEGVTMYFAEVLMRKSGSTIDQQSRVDELADEIRYYHANAGNTRISPERGSWASIYGPDSAGDYLSNFYTQGRLIAEVLDIVLRDSTNGRRGMADVMRVMYSRYAHKGGFSGVDIERVTGEVCGCNLQRVFEDHVRNARPIEFNKYLTSLGLQAITEMVPAVDSAGTPWPDLRISAYQPPSGRMRVRLMHPETPWRRAGLHSGMEYVAIKGIPIDSFPDFRRAVRSIRIGEVIPVDVTDAGKKMRINVTMTGYDRHRVRIVELPNPTPAQRIRRREWEEATAAPKP